MKFKDGHHVISNDNYHDSDGISRSRLMNFQKSPKHYQQPKEFKGSSAMVLGSLVHNILLEPALFDIEFAVVPEINKRTKIGKMQWEAFQLEHQGKTLVTQEQLETANLMCAAVMENKDAKALLSHDALVENSIYWEHKETKIQYKCRPDFWCKESGLVVDLKTTADASPWSFSNSAYKFNYFTQAAMIREGLASIGKPMTRFVIIAVENTFPFVPAVYVLDDASIDMAAEQFHKIARKLKSCIDSNDWPDYGVNMLSMPKYAERDFENE